MLSLHLIGMLAVVAQPARVTLEDGVVRARPAPPGAVLEVFVDAPGELPPLLGSLRREEDALVFAPRYPLAPGMSFRAVFRAAPWWDARSKRRSGRSTRSCGTPKGSA